MWYIPSNYEHKPTTKNSFGGNATVYCAYPDVPGGFHITWRYQPNCSSKYFEVYYASVKDDAQREPGSGWEGFVLGKFVDSDNRNHSLTLINPTDDGATLDCLLRTDQCPGGEFSNRLNLILKCEYTL